MRLFLLIFSVLILGFGRRIDASGHVHVIGDSHTFIFRLIPGCNVIHIGPVTMHRVGRDGTSLINLPYLGVQEGDAVVFVFGEIDVRCHIGKQRDHFGRDEEEVLETLVSRYMNVLLQNRSRYHHVTCVVYLVVPPADHIEAPEYPIYGSLEDRINITKRLNTKLIEFCKQNEVPYIDVYETYATPEGSLNPMLSDGLMHIKSHWAPIKEELDRILQEKPF